MRIGNGAKGRGLFEWTYGWCFSTRRHGSFWWLFFFFPFSNERVNWMAKMGWGVVFERWVPREKKYGKYALSLKHEVLAES